MRKCEICSKAFGHAVTRKKTRSKYNPTNYYRQQPNLQLFTLVRSLPATAAHGRLSAGKRVKVCTGCRRRLTRG